MAEMDDDDPVARERHATDEQLRAERVATDDDCDDRLTASGHVERRTLRPYVTRDEFTRWRNRAAVLFLALAVVSSVSGWFSYRAGKSATDNLIAAGRDATTKSCLSGVDLRLASASGLDDLRRLAVTGASDKRADAFIILTQPPIDRLLSQAVGRPYHVPPQHKGDEASGRITGSVADQVRELGRVRCAERTDQSFRP